jgi:hypothetical protein
MKKTATFLILSVMILGLFVLFQNKRQDVISRNVSAGKGHTPLNALPGNSITQAKGSITITPRYYISPSPDSSAAGSSSTNSTMPMFLTVTQPHNNATVSSPNIVVKGQTVAGADVLVNDIQTKADSSGNFSLSVILDPGVNTMTIVANNDVGDYVEKEIVVNLSVSDSQIP